TIHYPALHQDLHLLPTRRSSHLSSKSSGRFQSAICASVWLVKLLDITKEGCPVAFPRFMRRPSERRITSLPSSSLKRSTCGLILSRSALSFSQATSISLSK